MEFSFVGSFCWSLCPYLLDLQENSQEVKKIGIPIQYSDVDDNDGIAST